MTGIGSHQSAASKTDNWFTPPALIEALGGVDSFDLDPASHVNRPWSTARNHYTIEDNGLLREWFGRVWLNPPYSKPLVGRFMSRMADHGRGVALIFARTETDAFFQNVWDRANGLLFLRGRLHFHDENGERAKGNAGAPSVLIAYGADDLDILAAAPIDGQLIPLRLPKSHVLAGLKVTWRQAVEEWFERRPGPVELATLYRAFQRHPKARANRHWRQKLRQVLQRSDRLERVAQGTWQRRAA